MQAGATQGTQGYSEQSKLESACAHKQNIYLNCALNGTILKLQSLYFRISYLSKAMPLNNMSNGLTRDNGAPMIVGIPGDQAMENANALPVFPARNIPGNTDEVEMTHPYGGLRLPPSGSMKGRHTSYAIDYTPSRRMSSDTDSSPLLGRRQKTV